MSETATTVTTATTATASSPFFSYRGYPLVRCRNEIFYGNMSDEYICTLMITSTKKVKDVDIADKVMIMLAETPVGDEKAVKIMHTKPPAMKNGLAEALDIAYIWLKHNNN